MPTTQLYHYHYYYNYYIIIIMNNITTLVYDYEYIASPSPLVEAVMATKTNRTEICPAHY